MANLQKFKRYELHRLFRHFSRQVKNPSNDSIDPAKTHLNYNLADTIQPLPQAEFLKKRLTELKVQNRADVNLACSWVLTVPPNLPEALHGQFFKESFSFMADRYGRQNVISAYIHNDETRPHMHFVFIPVVKNKIKNPSDKIFKISAKELINKDELNRFHGDLKKHLELKLNREVAVLNEATIEGNRAIRELKLKSAVERMKEIDKIKEELMARVATFKNFEKITKEELDRIVSGKAFQTALRNAALIRLSEKYEPLEELDPTPKEVRIAALTIENLRDVQKRVKQPER